MAGAAGKVYLVGAGPGDPGLITVRGLEILGRADVVVYDRLGAPSLLRHCRPDARLVYVGKEPGAGASQEDINRLLEEEARAGRVVVRLKGGDPFVFGRGGEEALHLAKADIPFEVVPGVTSAVGVPAYAGIPLTFRGLSSAAALVSGRLRGDEGEERWRALAAGVDTVIFLMAMGDLEGVLAALLRHGRPPDTPAAVISWGTRARQRTVQGTLATVAGLAREAGLRNPAITVVGRVVALREHLAWFERKPLFGRRVLLTRPSGQGGEMAERLREMGAEVVEAPLIRIVAEDAPAADAVLERLGSYAWVVFTSANGVEHFFGWLFRRDRDARALAGCRLAAVGEATAAALGRWGLRADLVPREARGEALVEPLAAASAPGAGFLLPRGDLARPELPAGLRRLGFRVDEVVVYRTLPDEEGTRQATAAVEEGVDAVVLASPSAVDSLAGALGAQPRPGLAGARLVAIGPTTAARVRELGLPAPAVARRASAEGVAEALLAALAEGRTA